VIRLFWFVIKFAAVIALAVWLAEEPGKISLVWHGYSVEASAAVLCVAIFLLVAASLLAYRIVRLFRYGARGMKVRRQLHNQQLGLQRLGQGFTALAAGDAAEAGKMALAARKLVGHTALTAWLQAQAAQLAGDHASASTIFTQLTKEKATAPLGYRGLIGSALRQNNHAKAAALVEDLATEHPKAPWLNVARYEVASRQGAWAQAAQALRRASGQNLIEVGDMSQREAALMVAEARTAEQQGQMPRALQAAEQAQKTAPDWLPARIALVQTLLAAGYTKPALKRVEKFWDTTPHPELGAMFLQALDEHAPAKQLKRVEQLCKNTMQHPASLVLLVQAALSAAQWDIADQHLARALTLAPTRQIYLLQAELAEKENQPPNRIRDMLRQAAQAPAEATWRCQSCGHGAAQWEINCPSCGASMSIGWFDNKAHPKSLPKTMPKALAHDDVKSNI
jgi:HemY protein